MMSNFKRIGKITVVSVLTLLTVISCKKDDEFFDIEDPQGIDSKIWGDEGAIGLFLNRT